MSNTPDDLLYTPEHEYVRLTGDGSSDGSVVEIGITDYAQGELGDIVFLELPSVGASYSKHDVFGTIEAVKAVSELFCPLAGEVTAVNDRLDKDPALVNSDPYGAGWMIRLRMSDPAERDELLKPEAYRKLTGE
ncbi:glycine cleavage system protein GcvH [soil metagenome]